MAEIVDRSFSARLDCHYLLLAPDAVTAQTPLVLALHGFGATPEAMLPLTRRLFDEPPVLACLQGPNQFFLDPKARSVGYGWITNRRPAQSIRLHHDMVRHTLDELGGEFGIPPERRLLAGFSQPVALNYRFAGTCPHAIGGVIAICGGLPGDWDTAAYDLRVPVLHIARRDDDFYPPQATERYPERLRQRAADVVFHLIEGGHQMPSEGSRIVAPWVARVMGRRSSAA